MHIIGTGVGASLLAGSKGLACPGALPITRSGLASDQRKRPIPSSQEEIPCVGLGTSRTFNVGETEDERAPLLEVVRLFHELGGTVLDTAPSYRASEAVSGDLLLELEIRDDMFVATKVRTEGAEAGKKEVATSMDRLHTDRLDLLQVHNLVDIETQLPMIRALKDQGSVRYVGITTSSQRQYQDVERWMKSEPLDFVQVDYSLAQRSAAERLLPLAVDLGMAVLVNGPYGRGRLFQATKGTELPDWATEFDCFSWGQFFLKYILGHPGVTAVIPATSKPGHLEDNMGAGLGGLPDAGMRGRMEKFFDAL